MAATMSVGRRRAPQAGEIATNLNRIGSRGMESRNEEQRERRCSVDQLQLPLEPVLDFSTQWNMRRRRIQPRRSLLEAQSTSIRVTSRVTSKLTARVIVESVSLAVIPAVTLTVRCEQRSCEFASRFRPAPAASAAVLDTSPRPLIPPSQRRRKGSAGGDGKKHTQNGMGGAFI